MKSMFKLFALAAAVLSLQACGVAEAQDSAQAPREEAASLRSSPGEEIRQTNPGPQGAAAAECKGDDGSTCNCGPGVACISTSSGCCCGCTVENPQSPQQPTTDTQQTR